MLLPKITCLLFLCSILRNKWVIKLIFLHADKHESFLQIDSMLLMGLINLPKIPKIASLQCLYDISKKVKGKVGFLHSDKHQSSYKAILSLLMGMNRHSQSTQNNKFSMSLQYPKKTLGMKIISIAISFLFYCDAKHSDLLPGSSHVCCYLLLLLKNTVMFYYIIFHTNDKEQNKMVIIVKSM